MTGEQHAVVMVKVESIKMNHYLLHSVALHWRLCSQNNFKFGAKMGGLLSIRGGLLGLSLKI